MLVNPHSENQDDAHEHEPQPQKYETMQCFAVSEPKSIKEEGDGTQMKSDLEQRHSQSSVPFEVPRCRF